MSRVHLGAHPSGPQAAVRPASRESSRRRVRHQGDEAGAHLSAGIRSEEAVGVGEDDQEIGAEDRKSTRLNSSHIQKSRMPSSA